MGIINDDFQKANASFMDATKKRNNRHGKKRKGEDGSTKSNHKKHYQNTFANRKKQAGRSPPIPSKSDPSVTSMKFASFNINGLDLEANWAVEQLLQTRGYDVSPKFIWKYTLIKFYL